ncbi:MAG: aminoacyl-tRNA hydrolase [Patescibacteria group bacterium]|nr:aminoacyl-tRNA hydrolase [Patescibacteria group bacterium]
MKIIVGLGNIGEEYKDTRHNIGFMVVEKLAKELGENVQWVEDKEREAIIASIGGVIVAKPTTYMNRSGEAVKKLVAYYKVASSDIFVIHDDIDLPLGKIRIREQGASGGHNGVESIIASLNTDKFFRFRMGIGRGKEEKTKHADQNLRHRSVIQFVLSRFTRSEAGELRKLVKRGSEAVRIALLEGIDKAMNRFN